MRKLLFTILVVLLSMSVRSQTSEELPLRLRVGAYNVGHFNEGKLGGYQGDDVQIEVQRWRNWVGEQAVDILALNEWNRMFDKDAKVNAQAEILEPYYNTIYWGNENKWIYNGIATNYKLENLRQVHWAGDYYAVIGDLKIGKKIITIMSTHIPWQKETHTKATAAMIAEMKKYEYVICMGDMNAFDAVQLDYVKEGFSIANGGSQGFFLTAPLSASKGRKDGLHLDNIITTKNIKILGVSAPANSLTARDHFPIIADVIITW